MAGLGQAKILGGIGSILTFLWLGLHLLQLLPVPYAGAVFAIVSWILVVIAVKKVADAIGDSKIFSNMLIAMLLLIIGIGVGAVWLSAALLDFSAGISRENTTLPFPASLFTSPASNIVGLVIAWVFPLLASIYIRRCYGTISLKTSVGIFNTTALLFLIGAATTIILVGFFVVLFAEILQAIAFFSLPDELPSRNNLPGEHGPYTTGTAG